MMHDRHWERLARCVTGESSVDEQESTKRWVESDAARAQEYEKMREVWAVAKDDDGARWNTASAWSQVARKVTRRSTPRAHASLEFAPVSRGWRYQWMIGAAAAVVMVIVGAFATRYAISRQAAQELARQAAAPMNEVATRRSQRATLQLVDGTRITLNVDSRIRYPQTYGMQNREIYLEGEGYFEVAHSAVPFVVHSAHGTVRDVGTRFVMSDYSGLEVAVAEGQVTLNATPLGAAMLGKVKSDGSVEVARDVDVADRLAWTEGRLVFAQEPLGTVVQRLSRWYDIDVRLGGGDSVLARVPFTASLTNENPESVLRLLAQAANARLERRGSAFVLFRK